MPTNDLRMGHYDITCQSEMLIPVVIICVYALIGIITSTVHVTFSALVRNYGHCTAAMLCHVALHLQVDAT